MRIGTHIFALVCALVLASGCHHSANLDHTLTAAELHAPEGSPKVLAAYQPWFGRANHINVGYSSQDPNILTEQIDKAKKLGISAFIVNWYGPRHPYEDKSYALMQQAAAENGFQTAIMYDEDASDPRSATDAVIVDLQYAYDRYIGPNAVASRSAYLTYNGRPVIFIFPKSTNTDWKRIHDLVNSWEDPPLLIFKDVRPKYANDFDGFYAWVSPGREGWKRDGSNWGEAYLANFYKEMTQDYPNKIAVGAAWPGFNDSRASWGLNRHMSERCGKTFEDSLSLFRRYYTPEHPLPFLMVVTWNDYEEGTAIERGYSTCNGQGDSNNLGK